MNEKLREIEVVATVEITYIYNGSELEELQRDGSIPSTPEELEETKEAFAEHIKKDIEAYLDPDHVSNPVIQYFEKEEDDLPGDMPETEESDG